MTQPCPRQRYATLQSQRDHQSRWLEDGTCSYCGSLHPDELFRCIEAGAEITPTDKNYKIYVAHRRKFYFWHLDDAGEGRFVDLCNEQKVTFAEPGYFYVLPYFCAALHKGDGN